MTSLGAPSAGVTASAVERAPAGLDVSAVEAAFREQDELVFIKEAFACFGVRTLWQSRARARHGRLQYQERVEERRP